MRSILKFLIVNTMRKSPRFTSFILKLHRYALDAKFSGASQEKYLELLSMFRPVNHSLPLRRFGRESDGGYVLLDQINSKSICVSLGIADDISFDLDLAPHLVHILMFDYSISQPPSKISNSSFFPLRIVAEVTNISKEIDIGTIFSGINTDTPIILKVDIEGSEWESFKDIGETQLSRCHQIVFELHNLQKLQFLPMYPSYFAFLRRLDKTHSVVNSHVNNWDSFEIIQGIAVPNVLEVTYVRKDLVAEYEGKGRTVETVNFPNNPLLADFKLYPFNRVLDYS